MPYSQAENTGHAPTL